MRSFRSWWLIVRKNVDYREGQNPRRILDQMTQSLPARIVADVRARLDDGTLSPGDRVESTRTLARQLGVSRGSVVTAYEQLVGEGFLTADRGGTRVNPDLPARRVRTAAPRPQPLREASLLSPGVPDTTELATHTWRAAWRMAAAEPTAHPAPGSARLRRQIADHVRLTRSVTVTADNVVVTAGARDGLRTIMGVTEGPVGVDDPGFPTLHAIPRALGREVVPVTADAQGMSIDALAAADPSVVLVMPNHLYPTGAQMTAGRRIELIDWARGSGALIVEDDYDSELRPAHAALAGLDEHAVLLGSFAKTLTPALGLGYLIVPDHLVEAAGAATAPVSGVVQDAMANFMAEDGLRRHTAKMRRIYRRRRRIVSEILPGAVAMDGGLHAVIEVADRGVEERVVKRCRQAGFGVAGLADYWTTADRGGVVLGVGGLDDDRLRTALQRLAALVSEQR